MNFVFSCLSDVKEESEHTHAHTYSHLGAFVIQYFTCSGILSYQNTTAFQMKKYSGCMCTFANEIKTLNLFEYEQMQVNIVYLN